jgi:hypothetical protein
LIQNPWSHIHCQLSQTVTADILHTYCFPSQLIHSNVTQHQQRLTLPWAISTGSTSSHLYHGSMFEFGCPHPRIPCDIWHITTCPTPLLHSGMRVTIQGYSVVDIWELHQFSTSEWVIYQCTNWRSGRRLICIAIGQNWVERSTWDMVLVFFALLWRDFIYFISSYFLHDSFLFIVVFWTPPGLDLVHWGCCTLIWGWCKGNSPPGIYMCSLLVYTLWKPFLAYYCSHYLVLHYLFGTIWLQPHIGAAGSSRTL